MSWALEVRHYPRGRFSWTTIYPYATPLLSAWSAQLARDIEAMAVEMRAQVARQFGER